MDAANELKLEAIEEFLLLCGKFSNGYMDECYQDLLLKIQEIELADLTDIKTKLIKLPNMYKNLNTVTNIFDAGCQEQYQHEVKDSGQISLDYKLQSLLKKVNEFGDIIKKILEEIKLKKDKIVISGIDSNETDYKEGSLWYSPKDSHIHSMVKVQGQLRDTDLGLPHENVIYVDKGSGNLYIWYNKEWFPVGKDEFNETPDCGYTVPEGGIPKEDLSTEVQGLLDKAGTAILEHLSLDGKVDKIVGKGLSEEDYTTEEKNKLARLNNYNDSEVWDKIRELERKIPVTPTPSQFEGDVFESIYIIKPGTQTFTDRNGNQIEATLTEGMPIDAYSYYYETVNSTRKYKYGDTKSTGTDLTYEIMHQNGLFIEMSIDYAYDLGYRLIMLLTGNYCLIPERQNNSWSGSSYPTIKIFNKEHLDINLGGSTLYFVVDSEYANPYYNPDRSNTSGYNIWATMISFCACNYVKIHNGTLIGDKYTRKFSNTNENRQELTYGIGSGLFCQNIMIDSIDVSGFMGDGIGTGSHGTSIYVRNKYGNYFDLDSNGNYVLDNAGNKVVKGELLVPSNYIPRVRFVYDAEKHNLQCTGGAGYGYNLYIPFFEGPGYNQRILGERYSYATVSMYLRVKELRDFGIVTKSYENYDTLNKAINGRTFFLGGDKVGYKHTCAILTYAFPDDKIHFTYNNEEYTYYIGYTSGTGVSIGGVLADEYYVEGKTKYSRLGEIVKADGSNIVIDGTNYKRLDYRILAQGSTYSNNVKNKYRELVKAALNAWAVKPYRVIYTSYGSNFTLLPEETHIRIQFYFDKSCYSKNVFDGTSFGEAKSPESGTKYDFLTHKTIIEFMGSSNFVISNCNIHNNFRGGVTGGVDRLIIYNSRFYKDLTPTKSDSPNVNTALVDHENKRLLLPGFYDSTDYSIDCEEGGSPFTIVDSCKFERGVSISRGTEKIINTVTLISGSNFKFLNNICYCGVSIRFLAQLEVNNNIFYSGGVGLRGYLNTPYILHSDSLYLGNTYLKQYVHIHDNIFHRYTIPSTSLNNIIVNAHNNIYHVKGYDNNSVATRWNTPLPEWLLDKAKYCSFHDNIVLFYALDPEMYSLSFPIIGSGYNNKFINLGGVSGNVYLAQTGHNANNDVSNMSVQLGVRPTSTETGFNASVKKETLPIVEGLNFNTDTQISYFYGNPSTNLSVKNCTFDGLITHSISYLPWVDRERMLDYPKVLLSEYHVDLTMYDDSSVYRRYYSKVKLTDGFSYEDTKLFVEKLVSMLSKTVDSTDPSIPYITYTLNTAFDDNSLTPHFDVYYTLNDINKNRYSGYKKEILDTIKTYSSSSDTVKALKINTVRNILNLELNAIDPITVNSDSTLYIYSLLYYRSGKNTSTTDNNFTAHLNIAVNDPTLIYNYNSEESYITPDYNAQMINVEVLDTNYTELTLETPNLVELVETNTYYLNFKHCLFKKHPNIPIPKLDTDKNLVIRFIDCDFTELELDDNYAIKVDGIVQSHTTTTGIINNKIYYANDTKKYYQCVSKSLQELKLRVEFINCYTNDNFSINKQ